MKLICYILITEVRRMFQTVFKRYENKYLLDEKQYCAVLETLKGNAVPDRFGKSTVCSIYYDTPDRRLIRASIAKPVYKEKLRLRTYGVPNDGTDCFLELKKKYKGIVYKRRIPTSYRDGAAYMHGDGSAVKPSQIKNEIDYFKAYYGALSPSVDIFYNRLAFYDKNDPNVRLTFDSGILFRENELDLKNGIYGEAILPDGMYLMEIKTAGAMPLWTAELLSRFKIYPTSFSKYGTAYKNILNKKLQSGGNNCA